MADFLILKRDPAQHGPEAWHVVALATGKTADVAGATEALTESYTGPGRYGVVRADNARTVTVSARPELVEDETPAWEPGT